METRHAETSRRVRALGKYMKGKTFASATATLVGKGVAPKTAALSAVTVAADSLPAAAVTTVEDISVATLRKALPQRKSWHSSPNEAKVERERTAAVEG